MADEKLNSKTEGVLLKKKDLKKLWYHYLITNSIYIILTPVLAIMSVHISTCTLEDFFKLWNQLTLDPVTVALCSSLVVTLSTFYYISRPRNVYLINYACYKPDPSLMCSKELALQKSKKLGCFSEETLQFQKKVLERSGLGQKVYLPESLMQEPPDISMNGARKEAEMVMFGAIDELLVKTGMKAKDIGILIVNCGVFNPTPSLSAAVVNNFKFRNNILSYNLGGMGCSAGLISIDLAKHLLQVSLLLVF